MKKNILIVLVVASAFIILLSPFIKEYKENMKYDFTVNTIDGKVTKDDFDGKVLAIYFGYSYCPDVCPTSLSTLSAALNTFSQEKIDKFKGLFISVDPKRDKLKNLKEYAAYFHKNFIGSTSTKENIDKIVNNYGAYYKILDLEGSAMDYSVSHTSYIYIFDKKGKFFTKITDFSNVNEVKNILKKVL